MKHKVLGNQIGDWVNKKTVMEFLDYKPTQFNDFLRRHPQLKTAKIGRRMYLSVSSLVEILEFYSKQGEDYSQLLERHLNG